MATPLKVKIIRWSDPPQEGSSWEGTRKKKRNGWDRLLARLDEKPGEWALIRTSNKRYTVTQKTTDKRFRKYEFVTRKYYVGQQAKFGTWARRKPDADDLTEIVKG